MCVTNGKGRIRGAWEMDGWAGGGQCRSQLFSLSLAYVTHMIQAQPRGTDITLTFCVQHSHTHTHILQPTCPVYWISMCSCVRIFVSFLVCSTYSTYYMLYVWYLLIDCTPKSCDVKRPALHPPCPWRLVLNGDTFVCLKCIFSIHNAHMPLRLEKYRKFSRLHR